MFETLELGRRISKEDFKAAEPKLRQELLRLQFELRDRRRPVVVIVAGVEGSGRSAVVHRFNEWLDPHLLETSAFWDRSDEENSRPYYWRFWRAMPPKGAIGIFFGSWYTQPIFEHGAGRLAAEDFDAEMQRINEFERMLTDDGVLLVKLWFYVGKKTARKNLKRKVGERLSEFDLLHGDKTPAEHYGDFLDANRRAISETDTSYAPWRLIEAENGRYRDLTACETLRQALAAHLARREVPPPEVPVGSLLPDQPTILSTVPVDNALEDELYRKQLKMYQKKLSKLFWRARREGVSAVAVFEGWDAAGKGSALRRVTQAIDPRLFHLARIAAPTDEEQDHHYLWRFWRQLARDGRSTFFDRSWYGRVLVERVEGFARVDEWQRAYAEINRFEEHLAEHGSVVLKFWVHITREEQLARFRAREETPHKQHKITEEDWRNREKWDEYELAVHDMVTHTSTDHAPWTLVAGNDKKFARIQILKTFVETLEKRLG